MDLSEQTIGFLGCGKISSAVCRGFIGASGLQRPKRILVSERSFEKSAALLAEFPDIIQVHSSNEEIVRQSNIVFIGLIPSVAREVLPTMPWAEDKFVFSMMAAVNFREVAI